MKYALYGDCKGMPDLNVLRAGRPIACRVCSRVRSYRRKFACWGILRSRPSEIISVKRRFGGNVSSWNLIPEAEAEAAIECSCRLRDVMIQCYCAGWPTCWW